ncbi:MAG: hypothetical protein JWQ78_2243, partial [Sediminibacterium sp.]|nr:hypothetical protein [Sediminibacterium sp.]
ETMKKLFIAALMVVAVGSSAFAMDVNKISGKTRNNFENQFAGAENVTWSTRDTYTKAAFTLAEEKVEAFFATDGELIAFSRKADFKKLPLNAIQKIKKSYSNYTVVETIEFEQEGERSYYVSLEDGTKKQILQVSLYGNVSVYNGPKK